MLATPWQAPFIDDDWLFELKWDGVRCILSADPGGVKLHSRTGKDMTERYPQVSAASYPQGLVLDGEIVALGDDGLPSFERLQGAAGRSVEVSFVVFDLLHAGEPMIMQPLHERVRRLDAVDLPPNCTVPDRFESDPSSLWEFVRRHDLEGIVAKRRDSVYRPGVRSPDWRKVSNWQQVRAVVGGFTRGTGGRAASFGALLLGLWVEGGLRFVGSVGTGFDDATLHAIRAALDEMAVPDSPFVPTEGIPHGTWVAPRLVAVVRFKQWTAAGRLRAPAFKGFSDIPTADASWLREGPR
ncbi:MAG: non-homologous end-joining DNA ligase [Acidimicrobiia bacterium]|nr:non-homologous end-joining DNA ligase [Acidimicrobiia bacterium]